MKTHNTLELVQFRLNEGITKETFMEGLKASGTFLEAQPGFVSRQTAMAEDGTVYDMVEWASLDDAQNAAQEFMSGKHPELGAFMQCVDMADGFMKHGDIVFSTS